MDIHDDIQFFLYRERILYMPGVFDNFFDQSAIEARKRDQQPSEQEQLIIQGRADALRHLTDFSSMWGKPVIEEGLNGVKSAGVPSTGDYSQMLKEYKEAQRKDTVMVSGNGWSLSRDEFDNITIRTSQGIVMLGPNQWTDFVRAVLSIPQGQEVPTAYGYQNGSQVVTSSSHTPSRKSQTELVATMQRGYKDDRPGAAWRQNEERRKHATEIAYKTGNWGSKR